MTSAEKFGPVTVTRPQRRCTPCTECQRQCRTTQSRADRQSACAAGKYRGDWRGISAKRIRNQLLGRHRCVALSGSHTAAISSSSSSVKPSLFFFALVLLFSFFSCSPFLSPLFFFYSDISLMHVCGCHRDLALSVTACFTLLIHFRVFGIHHSVPLFAHGLKKK